MLPYRFEQTSSEQPAPPTPPSPPPQRRPGHRMLGLMRRVPAAFLLALALVAGVGLGTAGTLAIGEWFTVEQPTPTTTVQTSSPLTVQRNLQAQVPPTANNVAGSVFNSASPSVVSIIATGQARNGLVPEGGGSGFVVDADGLILTNYHVVAGSNSVRVRFSNGEERDAQVVGSDRGNDLALLRVDLPAGVPAITLGDSDQVAVGETVIAIGSPFGLDQTVTQGIVSAVDRTWWAGGGPAQRDLIQTDAAINPGNSGGPLLNARGEVIGITTSIESPVRGNVGIGFAVPINTARDLLPELASGAHREPARLGIAVAQEDAGAAPSGVAVDQVAPGSAADQAGLQPGDVITALNGEPVDDLAALSERLTAFQPGDTVTLTIVRNGQAQQIEVTLQAWTESFR